MGWTIWSTLSWLTIRQGQTCRQQSWKKVEIKASENCGWECWIFLSHSLLHFFSLSLLSSCLVLLCPIFHLGYKCQRWGLERLWTPWKPSPWKDPFIVFISFFPLSRSEPLKPENCCSSLLSLNGHMQSPLFWRLSPLRPFLSLSSFLHYLNIKYKFSLCTFIYYMKFYFLLWKQLSGISFNSCPYKLVLLVFWLFLPAVGQFLTSLSLLLGFCLLQLDWKIIPLWTLPIIMLTVSLYIGLFSNNTHPRMLLWVSELTLLSQWDGYNQYLWKSRVYTSTLVKNSAMCITAGNKEL